LRFTSGVGSTLNNLTVNTVSGSSSLGSNLNINNLLTLTSGALALNGNTLTLNSTGNIAGSGTGTLTGSTLSNLVINSTGGLTGMLNFTPGSSTLNNLGLNTTTGGATMGSDLGLNGLLTLTSGTLTLNGHALSLNGAADIAAAGTGTLTGSTASDLAINTIGSITGALNFAAGANTLHNLVVNMGATTDSVILGTGLTIGNSLGLLSGIVATDNNDLVIAPGASISGGSAGSYVATTGSGNLVMNLAAGNTDTFKVGTLINFAPMAIKANSGSATGNVSINVINGVYSAGTSGSLLSATLAMVDATWHVTSTAMPSGINYDMEAMWSTGMEVNGFDRTMSFISHYTGGAWDIVPTAPAGTSGSLHTALRTGLTSLSPFMVTDGSFPTRTANTTKAAAAISVYPNPAGGVLYFSAPFKADQAAIFDMTGLQVLTANGIINSVPVADLAPGSYVIKLSGKDGIATARFVKE